MADLSILQQQKILLNKNFKIYSQMFKIGKIIINSVNDQLERKRSFKFQNQLK